MCVLETLPNRPAIIKKLTIFLIKKIIINLLENMFILHMWGHCGIFENGVLLMYTLEGVSMLQTLLLLKKSLNKTETPIL